jgi:crossover junction endodeoxyribonuclease RuvC
VVILGIDPGTAITGWGVINCNTSIPVLIEYGHILTQAKTPLSDRLDIIHKNLTTIIMKYKPNVVAVEELFFAKNVKTAITVGHARGVILLTSKQLGLEIFEYTPLEVKQAVAGYGFADKIQMQKMVKCLLKLDHIPNPDDAADALAVALCHQNRRKWDKIVSKNS